jgi:hypothetical protein
MTKTRFLALVTAGVLLLVLSTTVFAQRARPHVFVGTATLDGAVAADGTVVTTWVDGAEAGSGTVTDGSYFVQADPMEDSFVGKTVSFKIGGVDANETFAYEDGGGDELALTATNGSAGTTTPGATAEPAATPLPGLPGRKGIKGNTGETGAIGATGSTGDTGAVGRDGLIGDTGAVGATGATGASGSAGSAGSVGADGDDGSSVLGIIAIILAAVAIVGAGGAYMMGRRT